MVAILAQSQLLCCCRNCRVIDRGDRIFLAKPNGVYRADVLDMRVLLSNDLEDLKERVIGCAIAVHRELGPGLLESIYQACLAIELREAGLGVEREIPVPVIYHGQSVGNALKIDLIVEGRLVVEVKAVERIHPVYIA